MNANERESGSTLAHTIQRAVKDIFAVFSQFLVSKTKALHGPDHPASSSYSVPNELMFNVLSADTKLFDEFFSEHPSCREDFESVVKAQKDLQAFFWSQGLITFQMPVEKFSRFLKEFRPVYTGVELLRFGGANDGGYLIPDDLSSISAILSPGVGGYVRFEKDLYEKNGIGSHFIDGTVENVPSGLVPLSFLKKNLNVYNDQSNVTLETWACSVWDWSLQKDYILQMDIEGDEYKVLLSTPESILKRFRIMVVEFHDIEQWCCPKFFETVQALFQKLAQFFYIAHIHPVNSVVPINLGGIICPMHLEYTFHRKDRCTLDKVTMRKDFPHPLDSPNDPRNLNVPLHPIFFS